MEIQELADQMTLITKLKWIRAGFIALARYGLHTLRDLRDSGILEDVLVRLDPKVLLEKAA